MEFLVSWLIAGLLIWFSFWLMRPSVTAPLDPQATEITCTKCHAPLTQDAAECLQCVPEELT